MTTTFAVATGADLTTALEDLSYGADAAPDTAYAITLSNGVTLTSAALSLQPGSSLTLSGPGVAAIDDFAVASTLDEAGTLAGMVLLQGGTLAVAPAGAIVGSVQGDDTASVAIDNAGSIVDPAAGSIGVLIFAGAIDNEAAARIGGEQFGVYVSDAGTLDNDGSITAAAATSGYGAYLAGGTLSNGAAGLISGSSGAADIAGQAVVSNLGTLLGGDQFGLVIGDGTLANGSASDHVALIDGATLAGVVSVGVEVQGTATATAITNDGTIGGHVDIGVALTNGTVTNDVGGRVLGRQEAIALAGQGDVFDAGTIVAGGGTGLATGIALGGGSVVVAATGTIAASDFGVSSLNAASISNAGRITAGNSGVALFGGGTVGNLAGAAIDGSAAGVRLVDGVGAITNDGTISGAVGVLVGSDGVGTVTDAGLISSTAGTGGAAVQFGAGAERLVLAAGGDVLGRVVGDDGAGSSTVLELAGGVAATLSALNGDAGTLADVAGGFGFSGIDGLQLDAGAAATAAGTFDVVAVFGTLSVAGTLSLGAVAAASTGVVAVAAGARLAIGSDDAAGSRIALASGGSTLVVEDPAAFGSGAGASYAGPAIEAEPGDVIELAGLPAAGAVMEGFAGGLLQLGSGAERASLRIGDPFAGEFFHLGAAADGGTDVTVEAGTPCYCHGTLILTDRGEVAVETLRIGERVITNSGAARPIRWIGHRCYSGRFAAGNHDVLPVLIRAGALGEGTLGDGVPRRDLSVSPLHAMYLDGVLIPAAALVNGVSIVQAAMVERVDYVHVELDTHDVILAEGAASETFVDDDSRAMFHNAAEYRRLYPDAGDRPARYCAPRVESGPVLEAVRQGIAARWRAPVVPGVLQGRLDHVGRERVCGWAQDGSAPTRLQVLDNDAVLCELLAQRHRPDLEAAGIGDGRHAFELVIPGGLSPAHRHSVQVRRAGDGAELPGSPWVIEAAPLALSPPLAPPVGWGSGRLDVATRQRISGWALGVSGGAAALQVLDNGVPIARVLANAPRPDLAASGVGGMGRCAFEVIIPADCRRWRGT